MKYLHFSTNDIKKSIENQGHTVCNRTNIISHKEKTSLDNLFASHLSSVFTPNFSFHSHKAQLTLYLCKKQSPGFHLITSEMLKEISKKGLILLIYLPNSLVRLSFWPNCFKVSIMIPRLGKNPNTVSSYYSLTDLLLSCIPYHIYLKKKFLQEMIASLILQEIIISLDFGNASNDIEL